jgi:hypothetical protein
MDLEAALEEQKTNLASASKAARGLEPGTIVTASRDANLVTQSMPLVQ